MEHKTTWLVQGLGGTRNLSGTIPIQGSKNGSFALLPTCLLFDGKVTYKNIPLETDIINTLNLLEEANFTIKKENEEVTISVPTHLPKDFIFSPNESMRGHIVFIGALLARFGTIQFQQPGGCVIGKRPIDIFLNFFQKFGIKVTTDHRNVITLSKVAKLKGINYTFHTKTVTATTCCVLTALFAEGKSTLHNCAIEPEITTMLTFLKLQGAEIEGIGTETLTIQGLNNTLLSNNQATAINDPDRIKVGSYLLLSLLTGSDISISPIIPKQIRELLRYIEILGINTVEVRDASIYIQKEHRDFDLSSCKALPLTFRPYPYLPTDLQTIISAFATKLNGKTTVKDTIYEDRIRRQFKEIQKFGVQTEIVSDRIGSITGPATLSGTEVEALDLRSAFAFLMLALAASGETHIHNITYLFRGYSNIKNILQDLGADIQEKNI